MIDDSVLEGRIPRLGTITVGHGVEATSRHGKTYARPTKSETLVLHTNDPELANAAQVTFGGDIATDSPHWDYDVITDETSIPATLFGPGFRQNLEHWRVAECVRRCDGVKMSTQDGRPASRSCLCAVEIAAGQERLCKPHTSLPVLLNLGVERLGVWEIRSTAWGTARQIKGAIQMLAVAGINGPVTGNVSMHTRNVRDTKGKVWEVAEIQVTIDGAITGELEPPDRPELSAVPERVTPPEAAQDRAMPPIPPPPDDPT